MPPVSPTRIERFTQIHPLADSGPDSFYIGGVLGYANYPAFT
ncbi:hypothetical protein [Streptomyces sp. IB201691-2A2]|nr:hypothetical protein [Streptomyces sp. IB201691-2A2]